MTRPKLRGSPSSGSAPDITLHFAGTEQHGRETYLAVVASNRVTFPDGVWTVDQIVADGEG
jgi:predicted ester cyclase